MTVREKRIRLPWCELAVTMDSARAERVSRSLPYRYIVKPALKLTQGQRPAVVPARPVPALPATDPARLSAEQREVWERITRIPWYHSIDLGGGLVTPGFIDHRPFVHLYGLPEDLTGARCLDIGTFDGFWSFEMERRGAAEVVSLDVEAPSDYDVPRKYQGQWEARVAAMRQAPIAEGFNLAREILHSRVQRTILNVYQLSPEKLGTFDVVFVSDVLVHLRDTPTILENMFSVSNGIAILAEGFDPELDRFSSTVSEFDGSPYPYPFMWWRHSSGSFVKMMQLAGFEPVEVVSRFLAESGDGPFWKIVVRGTRRS